MAGEARFCASCGTAVVPGSRFCKECGTRVDESTALPTAPAPAPAPVQAPTPAPAAKRPPAPLIAGLITGGVIAIVIAALALTHSGDGGTQPVAGGIPSTAATAATAATASTDATAATPSAAAVPDGWQTCVNTGSGFSIAYPAGWYTTDLVSKWNGATVRKPSLACNYFNPKPFEIYWGTEPPTTALVVNKEAQGLLQAVATHSDPRYLSVVSKQETEAGGLPAVLLEVTQSGPGYYPKGTLTYMYVIQIDPGRSLVVSTMFFPGTRSDYVAAKQIVDQAAQTIALA